MTGLMELKNSSCFLCLSFGKGVGMKRKRTETGQRSGVRVRQSGIKGVWQEKTELCLAVLSMCLAIRISHNL